MIATIILAMIGVALICWLLFALAINALPLFIGIAAGDAVFFAGAGTGFAIFVGAAAAAVMLAMTRAYFASAKAPFVRAAIALLVVGPAAFAGYHATLGIARIAVSSGGFREIIASFGSLIVGCAAFARLSSAARHRA